MFLQEKNRPDIRLTGEEKIMKKTVLMFFAIIFIFISANITFIYRLVFWNSSGIEDYKLFPSKTILSSEYPFLFDTKTSDLLECEKK